MSAFTRYQRLRLLHLWRLVFSLKFILSKLLLQDSDDMDIEIMSNTLYKEYLEDLYKFCQLENNFDFSY